MAAAAPSSSRPVLPHPSLGVVAAGLATAPDRGTPERPRWPQESPIAGLARRVAPIDAHLGKPPTSHAGIRSGAVLHRSDLRRPAGQFREPAWFRPRSIRTIGTSPVRWRAAGPSQTQ
jgi:hypothetical protein